MNRNNERYLVKAICNSPYIGQYIQALQNSVLFSIDENLKPCNEISGQYQTHPWAALRIIEAYVKRTECNDERTDKTILSLLSNIIEAIDEDSNKEKNSYKQLSGNFGVMTTLFEVIISKVAFFDNVDVVKFTKLCLDNPLTRDYSFVYLMKRNKSALLNVDKRKIFELHTLILEHDGITNDCLREITGKNINEFIENNPIDYYGFSKGKLEILNEKFYTLGSVDEYTSFGSFRVEQKDVYLNWFKQSSVFITAEVVQHDAEAYLNNKQILLRKMGVFLLSNHFEDCIELFYQNLSAIVRDHYVYSDLRCLIENNIDYINQRKRTEELIQTIRETVIDVENDKVNILLKNRLYSIISRSGYYCAYTEENERDREYVNNYNKMIYPVKMSDREDIEKYKKKFAGKDFKSILEVYQEEERKSHYYEEIVRTSIVEYVCDENLDVREYASEIPEAIISSMIYEQIRKQQYGMAKQLIKCIIEENLLKNGLLSAVLYACRVILESDDNDSVNLIMSIDYRTLPLRQDLEEASIVDRIYNEWLFEYLNILSKAVSRYEEGVSRLKELPV